MKRRQPFSNKWYRTAFETIPDVPFFFDRIHPKKVFIGVLHRNTHSLILQNSYTRVPRRRFPQSLLLVPPPLGLVPSVNTCLKVGVELGFSWTPPRPGTFPSQGLGRPRTTCSTSSLRVFDVLTGGSSVGDRYEYLCPPPDMSEGFPKVTLDPRGRRG